MAIIAAAAIAAGAGLVGSAVSANQQSKSAEGAANEQAKLAAQLAATPVPGQKWSLKRWKKLLGPEIEAWLAGQRPQVISPDLQDLQYQALNAQYDKTFENQQKATQDAISKRGLDYGNIGTKALADLSEGQNRVLLPIKAGIATDAAKTNYAATEQKWHDLADPLQQVFQQGNQLKQGYTMGGYQGATDANNALYAADANRWNGYSSALSGLGGVLSGYMQNNSLQSSLDAYLKSLQGGTSTTANPAALNYIWNSGQNGTRLFN